MRGSAQPLFTCSNSIELTSAMYKVNNKDTRTTSFDAFLVSFMLTLNKFYTLFYCFYCWLWACKCPMGRRWRATAICNESIFVTCQIAWCQKHLQLQRFATTRTHWCINYLREKIYNDYKNVLKFLRGVKHRPEPFQNITLNVKRFQ